MLHHCCRFQILFSIETNFKQIEVQILPSKILNMFYPLRKVENKTLSSNGLCQLNFFVIESQKETTSCSTEQDNANCGVSLISHARDGLCASLSRHGVVYARKHHL